MSDDPMKLLEELKKAGVPIGGWQPVENATLRPLGAEAQVKALTQLRDFLQLELDRNVQLLEQAQQQAIRSKRGGGV